MIHSMTAFARQADQGDWGSAVWELRSINHRYLDISIRLPDTLRELETNLRELIRGSIKRGKLECNLNYVPSAESDANFSINNELVKKLASTAQQIVTTTGGVASLSTMEILAWPGVVQAAEADMAEIHKHVLALFEKALHDLVVTREREGRMLVSFIAERLGQILEQLENVKKRLPKVLSSQHEKMLTRLEELETTLDRDRLEQEILLFAQKMDVSEEIARLHAHVEEVQRVLKKGGVVGRRLDFFMQELNREANTLASKSVDTEITHMAVEFKVLVEQMREQVQNIE